ncbi:unnamed protein product [Rotaria sordida]|uniref:Uncharacterized protein n=1 Tax=Rotaria sordida TaxID=392033 RepID=A0A818V1J3_9BILA|nr:unnamed protein product [Rotaria sordida]CAF3706275.1 unnamed protein product [Rotaria sordida]CAF3765002.1 unnamed protein product [Rotaria sordida]
MQKLINHVRNCNEFTFDTEGEKSTKQLALIQIQTIPQQLPFFVILVELAHLPEIYPAIVYQWFEWPIKTSMVNLQLKFAGWYS